MSPGFYCVTAYRGTSVSTSVAGNFTAPGELNLLISKHNWIEVHLITPEGLRMVKEFSVFGKIAVMKLFRPLNEKKDLLFVVTELYDVMILRCQSVKGKLEILTEASNNMSDKIGRVAENGIIAIIDSGVRLIAMRLYDGLLKIIPIDEGYRDLRSYSIRMEEADVQDIEFLHGCDNPTIALIYQDTNGRHLKVQEISVRDREFVKMPWKQENVEMTSHIIIPVPEPIGGVILIGEESVLYHNGIHYVPVAPACMKIKRAVVTCYTKIDELGRRYLLGNISGELLLLYVETEERIDETVFVKDIKVEFLGETSIPETITYLDNGVVYIGSRIGDSQLIKLNEDKDKLTDQYITVLETYNSIGPILDMTVVDLEKQGQGQLVTCSGAFKDGSLRIIRNGIGIHENASVDLIGVKGIWVLDMSGNGQNLHDTIVLSFVGHTRVLTYNEEEVEEREYAGFVVDEQTFYSGNVDYKTVLQVTQSVIRLISAETKQCLNQWEDKNKRPISIVAGNAGQLVCAIGCDLLYFEVVDIEVILKRTVTMKNEISCLDISPINGTTRADFVAVGLWTDISAHILRIPDLTEVHCEFLGGEITPRSILLTIFGDMAYLLVALGDGALFSFRFNPFVGIITEKKRVTLGTQQVVLRAFQSNTTMNVFACSDRPTVIYSSNNKLVYANVNLKQVNYMCPISSTVYPESLVLATDTSIIIGTIDEIQKLHIRSVHLGEAPKRIVYQESTKTFGVVTMRREINADHGLVPYRQSASLLVNSVSTSSIAPLAKASGGLPPLEIGEEVDIHSLLIMDENTFEVLHAHHFAPNEFVMCVESCSLGDDPKTYYIVGTALINYDDNETKVGRIVVFSYEDGKLSTIAEKDVKGACYSLCQFNKKLLASVNASVRLFEWTPEKELRIECSHFNNVIALYVRTKGDFILVGDLMRSMTLLQYKTMEGSLEEVARDYSPNWMSMIEIIDDDTFLGAENSCNVFVCQRDTNLNLEEERQKMHSICQFHIGDMVNVFRKGSLVMEHTSEFPEILHQSILYGTVTGAIGLITQLPNNLYDFLVMLQEKMAEVVPSIGNIKHKHWRNFRAENRVEPFDGFIDGDLVEGFLDLPTSVMEEITCDLQSYAGLLLNMKESYDSKEMTLTVNDVVKVIEDLTRVH